MNQSTYDTSGTAIRPLVKSDLDAVIAADRAITGRTRRGYSSVVSLRHCMIRAATCSSRRRPGGAGRAARVDGRRSDDAANQHRRRMVSSLSRDGRAIVTRADWRDYAMLRFLAAVGFALSPLLLLERRFFHRFVFAAARRLVFEASRVAFL